MPFDAKRIVAGEIEAELLGGLLGKPRGIAVAAFHLDNTTAVGDYLGELARRSVFRDEDEAGEALC